MSSYITTDTTFHKRLPSKCFKKFVKDILGKDDRFKDLHEYLAKYPYAIDQASRSFDGIAELSHGLDYTENKKRSPDSDYWQKFERPAPSRSVMEQAAIAYLEYRVYYTKK